MTFDLTRAVERGLEVGGFSSSQRRELCICCKRALCASMSKIGREVLLASSCLGSLALESQELQVVTPSVCLCILEPVLPILTDFVRQFR